MNFIVTYRDKSGALREECIEAAGRTECVAECRRRGIAPMRIKEGGKMAGRRRDGGAPRQSRGDRRQDGGVPSQSHGGARPSQGRRLTGRAAILAAAVCVLLMILGGGAWWWFCGRDSRLAGTVRPTNGSPETARPTSGSPSRDGSPNQRRSFVAKGEAIKTAKVEKPAIGDPEVFFEPKKQGRVVIWKVENPPVFTNQFEGFVADVLTAVPGERFLDESGLGDEFDEAFAESLKTEIKINPDDPEGVVAVKQAVIAAKKMVQEHVAAGERPRDVVLAARDELNKIADYRDQIQSAFDAYLLEENDPKEVLRFAQEANALLDEYGAYHIEGPHDEDTASEMLISAREEKAQELREKLEKGEKEEEEEKKKGKGKGM